jgi:O-6-methylguanine DNA methyltransferase
MVKSMLNDSFFIPPDGIFFNPCLILIQTHSDSLVGLTFHLQNSPNIEKLLNLKSDAKILQQVIGYLTEYFRTGIIDHHKIWTTLNLNAQHSSQFQIKVMNAICDIAPGTTWTYAQLGKKINSCGFQAIGSVLRHNLFPILLPCHRIIGSTNFGGYMGKTDPLSWEVQIKRDLIQFEKKQMNTL